MLEAHQLVATPTADGSVTLRHLALDVLYRSDQGAVGESEHVFINGCGLPDVAEAWRVLELGFGTGLNFLVTAQNAKRLGRDLDYITVDASPIPPEFVQPSFDFAPLAQELLRTVRTTGKVATSNHDGVRLTLYPHTWQETELHIDAVHAIFHDPFDPTVNPDCWTQEAFSWSRAHLHPLGRVSTYSAAGHIRRAMRDAGLYVARGPGYGKKREMTLASPTESALSPHSIKYRP